LKPKGDFHGRGIELFDGAWRLRKLFHSSPRHPAKAGVHSSTHATRYRFEPSVHISTVAFGTLYIGVTGSLARRVCSIANNSFRSRSGMDSGFCRGGWLRATTDSVSRFLDRKGVNFAQAHSHPNHHRHPAGSLDMSQEADGKW
jgi:hypothetical protein